MKSHEIRISDENPYHSVTAVMDGLLLESLWQVFSGNEIEDKTQSKGNQMMPFSVEIWSN